MVAAGHPSNAALYACMGFYFAALVLIAWVARRWKQHATSSEGDLQAHFGGSYKAPMLILTTFSTYFSGFTVTGVPQEAYERGFVSLRWIGISLVDAAGMLLLHPRLRRLAVERGYQSPNDFIADRYHSRRCSLLCAVCGCVPMLIFLSVQLISFAAVLGGITQDAIPKWAFMLAFVAIILGLEVLGGMNSVVLSDVVQGVLMISSFVIVPFAVGAHFGFFPSTAPADCPRLQYVMPSAASREGDPAVCAPEDVARAGCVPSGCVEAVRPEFYSFPALKTACDIAFFLLNNVVFPLGPFRVQRVYIAASDQDLRLVVAAMLLAPFVCQPPGIAIGLTRAALAPAWPAATAEATALSAVSEQLMKEGAPEYLLVSVLTTSTLAAIMSSADSALLGASSVASMEIFQGLLRPNASPRAVVRAGELNSLVLCAAAFCLGLFLSVGQMGSILLFNGGMLMQLAPAFFLGLFTSVDERPIFSGLLVGVLMLPVLQLAGNPLHPYVPIVNVAVLANFAVVAVLQALASGRKGQASAAEGEEPDRQGCAAEERDGGAPKGQYRFGKQLTAASIREVMASTREPPLVLIMVMVGLALLSVPWYGSPGEAEPVVMGLPRWGVLQCAAFMVILFVGLLAVAKWRPPARQGKASVESISARGVLDGPETAPVAPELAAPQAPAAI